MSEGLIKLCFSSCLAVQRDTRSLVFIQKSTDDATRSVYEQVYCKSLVKHWIYDRPGVRENYLLLDIWMKKNLVQILHSFVLISVTLISIIDILTISFNNVSLSKYNRRYVLASNAPLCQQMVLISRNMSQQ